MRYFKLLNTVWILIFVVNYSFAQDQHEIDSLKEKIKEQENACSVPCPLDTSLLSSYIYYYNLICLNQPDTANLLMEIALPKAEQLLEYVLEKVPRDTILENTVKFQLGLIYNNIGFYESQMRGDAQKAIWYFNKTLKFAQELNYDRDIAIALNNIGYTYYNIGDYSHALDCFAQCLDIYERTNNEYGLISTYNNLAIIYHFQGDSDEALKYWAKALELSKKLNIKEDMADCYGNMASVYFVQSGNANNSGDFILRDSLLKIVIDYNKKALDIQKELDDIQGMAITYNNLGNVFFNNTLGDTNTSEKTRDSVFDVTLEYYNQSLDLYGKIEDREGIAINLGNISDIYLEKNDIKNFGLYAKQCYKLTKEIGYPEQVKEAANRMRIYSLKTGEFEKAYHYYVEQILMRDSIVNEENYRKIQKQQARYEYEKKRSVDSLKHISQIRIKDLELAKSENEKEKQQLLIYTFIIGLILIAAFAILILRMFVQKKKANSLLEDRNAAIIQQKEEIESQRDEIQAQRDTVTKQKEEIELIHEEVSQSIDYATRIQSSILPEQKVLNNFMENHFVIFMPKDKVSGDFYWWAHIEDHTVITVADCTGHGVPGAFMSMLGVSFLREIVTKEYITHPGVILRKLRKEIIKSLKQSGELGSQKDGMDMSLVSLDHKEGNHMWAGANNPLYLIKNNEQSEVSFMEIKGDKMPIAIYERMERFTTHELKLEKGDRLYLFSDGYPDQFGGTKGKKYKYKAFKKLITETVSLSMDAQCEKMENELHSWMFDYGKNYEQIDDITVLGIEL